MRRFTCLLLMAILTVSAYSADYDIAAYEAVQAAKTSGNFNEAEAIIKKQIKKTKKKEGLWYCELDDLYKPYDMVDDRIGILEEALLNPEITKKIELNYRLVNAYFDKGDDYHKCDSLAKLLKPNKKVLMLRQNIKAAAELSKKPMIVEYEVHDSVMVDSVMVARDTIMTKLLPIVDMGDSINTSFDNLWPYITPDHTMMLTTVVAGKNTPTTMLDVQEDICVSRWKDTIWSTINIFSASIRTKENEGPAIVSSDNKMMILVRGTAKGSEELWYALRLRNGDWSCPLRPGTPLNDFDWQSTPSISADGKKLYFAGVKKKGEDTMDIWECDIKYAEDGRPRFAEPTRMGAEINTTGDEIAPFIHPYDSLLFFSSTGHGGMGGYDIFYSRKGADGKWQKAVNIGCPINTYRDEMGFTVDVVGKKAYLSSNGYETFSNNKRIFSLDLPMEFWATAPYEEMGDIFTLENIYFDTDKADLKAESDTTLTKFLEFLTVHPNYSIIVTGHTDNAGSEKHNQELSEQRAAAICRYLEQHGINKVRMRSIGLGATKPIADNDTEEGRAMNRRINVQLVKHE